VGIFTRRQFIVSGILTSALLFSKPLAWSGSAEERIKIGFIYPESGESEIEAKSLMVGFDLFFGEKGSCPVDIFRKPFGGDIDELEKTVDEWINAKNVRFIALLADLEISEKIIKKCSGAKVALFISNRSVKLAAGEYCQPNMFRVCANNYVSSEPLAPWAVQNVGSTVFITGDDDLNGNEKADFFAFGFERAGGAFADRAMSDGSLTSIQSIISSIKNSNADFVFAAFKNESAKLFLNTVKSKDSSVGKAVIGPETLTSFPRKIDPKAVNFLGVPTLTNVLNQESLRQKVTSVFGEMELWVSRAAEGYDLAKIVDNSAHENFLNIEDFETLLQFIANCKFHGLRGDFKFDKNHDAIVDSWVTTIEQKSGELFQNVVVSLGPTASLDFGCGKVGYPNRPDAPPHEPEAVWEENAN
jgi:branched-chain amino acid transport system substrate-binding protein